MKKYELLPEQINAIKGILILLIILGHNKVFYHNLRDGYKIIYGFHVIGFLALPFLYPLKRINSDLIVRYLVPFMMFSFLYGTLFYLIDSDKHFIDWLGTLILGLYSGSTRVLDQSTGLKMLWFLPTLLSLLCIRQLLHTKNPFIRGAIVFVVAAVHIVGSTFPNIWLDYTPFGIILALYITPVCYACSLLWKQLDRIGYWPFLAINLFVSIASCIYLMKQDFYLNLGDMEVYSYQTPAILLCANIFSISAIMSVFCIARFLTRIQPLQLIGKHSLLLYLLHPLFFVAQIKFLHIIYPDTQFLESVIEWPILLIGTFLVTILGSLIAAEIINRIPLLKRSIIPKNRAEWIVTSRFFR